MRTALEQLLADAGASLHEPRRPFDVPDALRRLAHDAGYTLPPVHVPAVSRARHRLTVVARWQLSQPGAAFHLENLTAELGDERNAMQRRNAELAWDCDPAELELDIEGAQVFACMLYLADHPESAQFWWQFAAGAGNRAAAYCLYLRHLSLGETREATHWLHQLQWVFDDGPSDDFLEALETFAGYVGRHGSAATVPTGGLEADVERLADSGDTGGLVCRPTRQLAARLHHLAEQS
ncbi:hypothetical protein [Streptomyces niveus]|uniref:hypothetical protein n=1 Tax=Streptomyces niveus TaxID=193462 RepID=UPI0003C63194|nr:hypothetical protein [Streptomyces niveus]EST31658.1 hypothetical protein M877_06685 [Streptomyces niveus NCIMB 11891]